MQWRRQNADPLTRKLARASYVLTIPRRQQPVWWWLAVLVLAGAGVTAYALQRETPAAQLRAERDALQARTVELEQAVKLGQMQIQQETATREELMRQVDGLTQRLKQAEQELSFIRTHQRRAAAASEASGVSTAVRP